MKCPKCQFDNPDDAQFCIEFGDQKIDVKEDGDHGSNQCKKQNGKDS